MLRLNMAIAPTKDPSRLGILKGDNAGFPNGRRLFDDVVDIAERVVAGATGFTPKFNKAPNNQLGDGINVNDRPFLPYFPYVAPPHNPFDHDHHPVQHSLYPQNKGDYGRQAGRYAASPAEAATDEVYEDAHANEEEADVEATDSAAPAGDAKLRFQGANPGSVSRLEFSLPVASRVSLKIFDLQGREIRTLLEQDADAGPFGVRGTAAWATARRGICPPGGCPAARCRRRRSSFGSGTRFARRPRAVIPGPVSIRYRS
jgi:hypothetical protein